MKNNFKFILSDDLGAITPYYSKTVFTSKKHDSMKDRIVVSWEDEDGYSETYYSDTDVATYLDNGDWIVVE